MGGASDGGRTISLGFSDEELPDGQHVCYLYNDDRERMRVMSRYLAGGLAAGDRLLYFVDSMTPDEMLDCLETLGVDARAKPDQLTVVPAVDAYCPRGAFSPDEMLAAVGGLYQWAVAEGRYPGLRGSGEMSWCLVEGRADERALMAYEARLNQFIGQHPVTACCQYDTRRFDGATIMDVLAVHPLAIVRGQLVRNPYYVAPDVFLAELDARTGG